MVLWNSVKKTCKKWFTKLMFQTKFCSGSYSIKHSLVCYQTPCCVCCIANAKAGVKQKQSKSSHAIQYWKMFKKMTRVVMPSFVEENIQESIS